MIRIWLEGWRRDQGERKGREKLELVAGHYQYTTHGCCLARKGMAITTLAIEPRVHDILLLIERPAQERGCISRYNGHRRVTMACAMRGDEQGLFACT
ncbi:hypothetical protein MRB53_037343 [Persea americana]|nr:hypothetical protein MRB53_037343 [Persea americana]